MYFDTYDLESPYDEIQNQVYEKFIGILDNIDINLKHKNFILSGGFLIHHFIKKTEPYDFENDIDLFFQTPKDFFQFDFILNEFLIYNSNQKPAHVTNNAKTYHLLLNDDTTINIQLINLYFGKPEEILKKFDLQNCQIALDQNGILTLNSSFEKFYNQKKIVLNEARVKENFNNLGKEYLFIFAKRIHKYINKYILFIIDNYNLISEIENEYFEILDTNFTINSTIVDSSGDSIQIQEDICFLWTSITYNSYNYYKNFKPIHNDWIYTHQQNNRNNL